MTFRMRVATFTTWLVLGTALIHARPRRKSAPPLRTETLHFVSCHDGDTCRAKNAEGATLVLRLVGIDAPEVGMGRKKPGQAFGAEARTKTRELVVNRDLKVDLLGHDRYGRYLALIHDGKNVVNWELVEAGLAFAYRGQEADAKLRELAEAAEARAKKAKRGFWGKPESERPEEPRMFRRKSRR